MHPIFELSFVVLDLRLLCLLELPYASFGIARARSGTGSWFQAFLGVLGGLGSVVAGIRV